jgi:hypothetical protein
MCAVLQEFLNFRHEPFDIVGHPTDFVHRVCLSYLSFIDVQTDGGIMKADQYLLLTGKDTKLASSSITVLLDLFSLGNEEAPSPIITVDDRNFLILVHGLSKICMWHHNRKLITSVFGHLFSVVTASCISALIRKLEELLVLWNDFESDPEKLENYLQFTKMVLCTLFGMTQLLSRFAMKEDRPLNEVYSVPLVGLPPYSFHLTEEFDLDVLSRGISPSPHQKHPIPIIRQSSEPTMLSSGSKKKVPKNSNTKALKPEEAMSFVLPILMSSIRKLYLFSKTVGTLRPKNAELEDLANKVLVIILMIHNETVLAAGNMLLSWPQLLPISITSDCASAVNSFLNLKDAYHFNTLTDLVKSLIFQRSLLVIHYHDAGIHASINLKNQRNAVLQQLQDCLKSLESLFSYYIEEIKRNRKAKIPKVIWKVKTISATKLTCSFPHTDLFPWSLASSTTTAMFRSKMTEVSQEHEASFVSFIGNYWKLRKNFIPTKPEHVHDETKTYLSSIQKQLDKRNFSEKPSAPDPVLSLLDIPEGVFMHKLFTLMIWITWKSNGKVLTVDERRETYQEILRGILNIVKTNGISSFPDTLFWLLQRRMYLFNRCNSKYYIGAI